MPENVQNMLESALGSLRRRGLELPRVRDVMAGVNGTLTDLPQRVLVFHLRDLGQLVAELHHRMVWAISVGGCGHIQIDGQVLSLHAGQSALVFPYQSHGRLTTQEEGRWLLITFEIAAPEVLAPLRQRSLPADLPLLQQVDQVIRSYQERQITGQRVFCTAAMHLAAALEYLLHLARESPPIEAANDVRHPDIELLRRAIALIQEYLEKPLTVSQLADLLAISEKQLRRVTLAMLSVTPKRLILHMKMSRAIQLLRHQRKSVHETAAMLGFESPYAFSRMFTRIMGHPPKSYKYPSPTRLLRGAPAESVTMPSKMPKPREKVR